MKHSNTSEVVFEITRENEGVKKLIQYKGGSKITWFLMAVILP